MVCIKDFPGQLYGLREQGALEHASALQQKEGGICPKKGSQVQVGSCWDTTCRRTATGAWTSHPQSAQWLRHAHRALPSVGWFLSTQASHSELSPDFIRLGHRLLPLHALLSQHGTESDDLHEGYTMAIPSVEAPGHRRTRTPCCRLRTCLH